MINLDIASKVYGWMDYEELVWLATQAQTRQRIVEIGSYAGRSTRALADNTPGHVVAVDTWEGSAEHEIDLNGKPAGFLYDAFLSNVGDLVDCGKIEPLHMTSMQAAKKMRGEGRQFDMVFIDASHLYGDVRADIESWLQLLVPGGLICGHDYSRYSGLDQAVRETFPNFKVMPYPGSIWYAGDVAGGRTIPYGPRRLKKALYTLNVGMKFSPEICKLTYPLMRRFADKCGATFQVITERKCPWMPITYEKLQIFQLAQEMGNDWNIYFDSDALIHPDTFDPTEHLEKDTVMHNGRDMAGNRWKYDNYFRRDGRHIGSGNWFTVASDWCVDLWRPPDDITLEQALDNISPTAHERASGITPDHLIDDYLLSRNIAKYGLKFRGFLDLQKQRGRDGDEYFWHHYTVPIPEKLKMMQEVLARWGLRVNEEAKIATDVPQTMSQ